ncbi:U3 small nucleolar RNA-associated protein 14 homolog A-like [Halyomorpha halys]
MFDEAEEVLKNHVAVSVKKIKSNLNLDKDLDEDAEENAKGTKKFEFKKSARLHDIDAALIEVADEGISSGMNDLSVLKEKLNLSESKKDKEPQIDPNKLITVKPQKLSSELPDFDEDGDDSEDEKKEKHLNLMEAFAEDDIVDQFREEKKEEEKTSKGKEIDLTLPGWGSWAGTGLEKKSRRKSRRFIVRFPKVPRKDKKKPNVIINEDPVSKLREQLVSELPYPFTSVKDFEASIRAPIGKNWVTEKGFKKLTAPPVVTKMGTIIEPMDGSLLPKKPKKRSNNNKPNVKSKKKKTN